MFFRNLFNAVELSGEEKSLFMELLGQKESRAFLVKRVFEGKNLAGIGGVIFRYWFIPSLFVLVKGESQGKGFGKLLVKKVLDEWGGKPLLLTVPVEHRAALHIYEKYGFRKISGWRKLRGKEMVLMLRFKPWN